MTRKKRRVEYEPNKCTVSLFSEDDRVFSVEIKKFGLRQLRDFYLINIMAGSRLSDAEELLYILNIFCQLEDTGQNYIWCVSSEGQLCIEPDIKYHMTYDNALSVARSWLESVGYKELLNATI